MNYKQHFLVGILFSIAALFLLNRTIVSLDSFFLILICAIFALLPDVDHDLSKGKQLLDYSSIFFSFVVSYSLSCSSLCSLSVSLLAQIVKNALILIGGYFVFIRFFKPKHRGITHSLSFSALLGALLYFLFGFDFSFFATLGYVSHLIADNHLRLF